MFDPLLPIVTQIVKPKTVLLRVHFTDELNSQFYPLRSVHQALEYRILNTLSTIFAETSNPAQPPLASLSFGTDVIADQNQQEAPRVTSKAAKGKCLGLPVSASLKEVPAHKGKARREFVRSGMHAVLLPACASAKPQ